MRPIGARTGKVVCSIAALVLTVGFLVLRSTPLEAAAVDLYGADALAWGLIVVAGITGLVLASSARGPSRYGGFGVALLSVLGSIAAPSIKGAHLGFSKDPVIHLTRLLRVQETGAFRTLRYVGLDSLELGLLYATGIPFRDVVVYLPLVSKVLFVFFLGLLATTLGRERDPRDVRVFLVGIPVFGGVFAANLYPELAALHYVPFLLAVAVIAARRPRARNVSLALLAGAALVVIHPRMSAYGLTVAAATYLWVSPHRGVRRFGLPVLFLVLWSAWFIHDPNFSTPVNSLADLFAHQGGFSGNTEKAVAIETRHLVHFGLVSFSPIWLVMGAGVVGALGLFSLASRSYVVVVLITGIVATVALYAPIFMGSQALSRAGHASIVVLTASLLALCGLLRPGPSRYVAIGLLALGLTASVVSIHRSPLMLQSSWHVDDQMVESTEWLDAHEEEQGLSAGIPTALSRLHTGPGESRNFTLSASSGLSPADRQPSDWYPEVAFVGYHARTETRCEHPVLSERIVVGSDEMHRPALCKLVPDEARAPLSQTYHSGAVSIYDT